MPLQITGRHVEITDAIRDAVNHKFSKLTRHDNNHHITAIHVILSVENHHQHFAEAKVDLAGAQIFAKSSDHDMYAAIDLLIDKLNRQLVKHKDKLKDHNGPKLIIQDEE